MSNGMRLCVQCARQPGRNSDEMKWNPGSWLRITYPGFHRATSRLRSLAELVLLYMAFGSQTGWASFADRYVAIPDGYRGSGYVLPGYGSTPVSACRDYFTKNGSDLPYTVEARVEGAVDNLGDPEFIRGPACTGLESANPPPGFADHNQWAFELFVNSDIDIFKNQGSDCLP